MSDSDSKRFYVYIHRRKDNNAIFYVGKGSGQRAYSKHDRNKHWRHIASRCGFDVEIVANSLAEHEAHCHEIFLIGGLFACGAKLANYTLGGEGFAGGKHTATTRAKMSRTRTGVTLSDSRRAAVASKTWTKEARAKRSESIKLHYSRPEVMEKMRATRSEQNRRPEVLAKNAAGVSRSRRESGRVSPVICATTGDRFECVVDAAKWVAGMVGKSAKQTRTAIMNSLRRKGTAYGYRWQYLPKKSSCEVSQL